MQEIPKFETGWEKLKRRAREEPLVPIGSVVTAGILAGGLISFVTAADAKTQQKFMRARVLAQGATVCAMVIGSLYAMQSNQSKQSKK